MYQHPLEENKQAMNIHKVTSRLGEGKKEKKAALQ